MPTKKKQPVSTVNKDIEEKYETFVQGLELIGLGLLSSSTEIDREAYFKNEEKIRSFSHEYELTELGKRHFDVVGRFSVAVAESKEADPALTIRCAFEAHIHGKDPIPKDHAERFTNSELKLILIPYARQFFSSMSSQMAIAPLVLPLTKRVGGRRPARS